MTRSIQDLSSLTAKLVRFGLFSLGGTSLMLSGHGAMAQEAGGLPDFVRDAGGLEASSSFDDGSDSISRSTEVTQSTESISTESVETTQAVESTEAASDCCGDRIQTVEATEATEVAAATNIYEAFRQDLTPYGRWIDLPGYGMCWQPANVDAGWRPYTIGRWTYTQCGLTWQSDEAFGECTYHYGRWISRAGLGWCWVPGDVWAPAWVSWRHGGGCIGWAPLSPEFRVGVALRLCEPVETSYCFVRQTDVCVPHIRTCVLPFERNTTIIRNTTNITRISVVNKTVINQSINVTNFERDNGCTFERTKIQTCTNSDDVRSARSHGVVPVYQPAKLVNVRTANHEGTEHVGRTHVVAKPHVNIVEKGEIAAAKDHGSQNRRQVATNDRPNIAKPVTHKTLETPDRTKVVSKQQQPKVVAPVDPRKDAGRDRTKVTTPEVVKPQVRKAAEPTVRPTTPVVRKSEPTIRKPEPTVRKPAPVEPTTRKGEPTVRQPAEKTARKSEPSVKPVVVNKPVAPTVRNERKDVKPVKPAVTQPAKEKVAVKHEQPKQQQPAKVEPKRDAAKQQQPVQRQAEPAKNVAKQQAPKVVAPPAVIVKPQAAKVTPKVERPVQQQQPKPVQAKPVQPKPVQPSVKQNGSKSDDAKRDDNDKAKKDRRSRN